MKPKAVLAKRILGIVVVFSVLPCVMGGSDWLLAGNPFWRAFLLTMIVQAGAMVFGILLYSFLDWCFGD